MEELPVSRGFLGTSDRYFGTFVSFHRRERPRFLLNLDLFFLFAHSIPPYPPLVPLHLSLSLSLSLHVHTHIQTNHALAASAAAAGGAGGASSAAAAAAASGKKGGGGGAAGAASAAGRKMLHLYYYTSPDLTRPLGVVRT